MSDKTKTAPVNGTPDTEDDSDNTRLTALRHEQLMTWGEAFWLKHYPDVPFVALWSSEGPGSPLARQRIKAGRKLKGGARYVSHRAVPCPVAPRIHHFHVPVRKVVIHSGTGAFVFSFERGGKRFDALYMSAYHSDSAWSTVELAFVPVDQLEAWADFEDICDRAANYLERSPKVYIIGARENAFEPKVAWEDVILSETLKADVRADIDGFFARGVEIYRQLGLAPFRKLLLAGPPGTGKSTLCVALARVALEQRYVVVYVSSSQKNGDDSNFDNIHRALRTASAARFPVLLIVEDLDAYLLEKDEKSQILNVLDGIESPNNPRGVLLVATTNFPEIIDERITRRPGRVDRIFYVPPIEDEDQALRMIQRYMGPQWREEHGAIARKLIGQTGVFVREVTLCARIMAANANETTVSLDFLKQSFERLNSQLKTGYDLRPKRPIGFDAAERVQRQPDFSSNRHDS